MKLNEKIYTLRRGAGLSQEELAGRLGVSRQAVGKWENGSAVPELDKVLALSKLFGVTLSELLGLDDEASGPSAAESVGYRREELEEIINKYAKEQDERNRLYKSYFDAYQDEASRRDDEYRALNRRSLAVAAVLGVMLVVVFVFAAANISRLNNRLSSLSSDIVAGNNDLNLRLNGMEDSITDLLRQQNSLFYDIEYEIAGLDDGGDICNVTLFATVKELSDSAALEFVFTDTQTGEQLRFTAERGELASFSADVSLPVDRDFTVMASVTDNGTLRSEELSGFSTKKEQFAANIGLYWFSNSNDYANPVESPPMLYRPRGTIILNRHDSYDVIRPDITEISVSLYLNGELLSTMPLDISDDKWSNSLTYTCPYYPYDNRTLTIGKSNGSTIFHTEFEFDAFEPEAGDVYSLVVEVTDEFGFEYEAELESVTFSSETSVQKSTVDSGVVNLVQ